MLDRTKVAKALQDKADQLFFDSSAELLDAHQAWTSMCKDPLLLPYTQAHPQLHLPHWSGTIDYAQKITPWDAPYNLVATDGSQIYPDKHQGTSCFLINIGSVLFAYNSACSQSWFDAEPFVFVEHDFALEGPTVIDIVNGKREEFELTLGLEKSLVLKEKYPDAPLLFMFDGSLIFWHLENKDELLKNYFVTAYNKTLLGFYQKQIPVMAYISLSKSKDLLNLLRAYSKQFRTIDTKQFPHLVDAHLLSLFLPPHHVSTIFFVQSHSLITYPPEVRPCFMYYNTGTEFVRLEFPWYMSQDKQMLSTALAIVADQVQKGNGYPIGTAEAHNQAVVQGPDRDFFYYLIHKTGVHQNRHLQASEKSLKKRKMSV
jgi:hypothetical protein